jgi:hypothetical protein
VRWTAPIAALVLAAVPASASAASYEYLTTYVGAYRFEQHYKAAPNRPDGLDTVQNYRWAVFDYDKVTVRADHTFTSRHTRWIAALGTIKQVEVQGSDLPGGPFTTTKDCTIVSSLKPVVTDTGGANVRFPSAGTRPSAWGGTSPTTARGRPTTRRRSR